MKMVELIIAGIIGAGLFFGGFFVGQNTKPTTEITDIKSTTYIDTTQRTEMQSYQVQMQETVIDTKGVLTNINISLRDISNLIKTFSTNTNWGETKTNKVVK
jgi:hypothetical protein